jgi:hypothetical protein
MVPPCDPVDAACFLASASQDCQYTLRRTAARGATTTGRTTGRATTTAAPGAAATQPARTTPRAQTTALASIVLKAMKPAANNREIIMVLITVLLGLKSNPSIAIRVATKCRVA